MSSEISPDFPVLDRSAIIVEPTAAFLAWVKAMPGDPFERTLQDIQEDCSVYLISEVRDYKAWLRRNYTPIFEQELISWCTDESVWPTDQSFKAFKKFFTIRFHSMVFDLGNRPVYMTLEQNEAETMTTDRHGDTKIEALVLKVTLKDSSPPVWRRIEIPNFTTLGDLHYAIQISMGWENSHLHEFRIGKRSYGVPDPDDVLHGKKVTDEDDVLLSEVLSKKGTKIEYLYDFGDGWEHEVVVEDIVEPRKDVMYPRCVDGARACPPEDCGGIDGYGRILEILQDPEDKEYETYEEWMPEGFDPEAFDVEAVNEEMKRIEEWRKLAEG